MHYNKQPLEQDYEHYAIEVAIKNGDTAYARELLRHELAYNPSAQVWYLSALVASDNAERVHRLKQALLIDPHHQQAARELEQAQCEISPKDEHRPLLWRLIDQVIGQRSL